MEGNQMKMREAVVQALRKLQELCVASCEDEDIRDDCERLLRSALSAPPRQCDVGTEEEQGERCMAQFDQWRRKGDGKKLITAIMAWAQTPYEEGAGK